MPNLRNASEPLAIALVLTAGVLINRCSGRSIKYRDNGRFKDSGDVEHSVAIHVGNKSHDGEDSQRTSTTTVTPLMENEIEKTPRRRKNLFSRFLAYFPFLMEIWYWLLTYWAYQGLRALSARVIADKPQIFANAVTHAEYILAVESFLGIDIELSLQQFLLANFPRFATDFLPRIYFSHIVLGVAFLVYCYTVLPRHQFTAIRRTLALENAFAFVVLTVYRCCPPRLMPHDGTEWSGGVGYEYRDLVHESSGNTAWTENKFRLVIAAMPSLHFANSVFVGWCLARFSPHSVLRVLGPVWPMAMWLTIIGTANHWVLDTVVGVCVLLAAWRFNRWVLVCLPVEDWVFGKLGVQKPDGADGEEEGW